MERHWEEGQSTDKPTFSRFPKSGDDGRPEGEGLGDEETGKLL